MTSQLKKKVLDVLKHTHRSIYRNISFIVSKLLLLLYYDKQFYFVHHTSDFLLYLSNEKCRTVRRNACMSDKQNENKWNGYSLPTLCSRVLLPKLTGQLVRKYSMFYETRRFIIAFTTARYISLTWAGPIQFMPPPPNPISWWAVLISFHLCLCLPSDVFPSDFPANILYAPHQHTSHSSWFDHPDST